MGDVTEAVRRARADKDRPFEPTIRRTRPRLPRPRIDPQKSQEPTQAASSSVVPHFSAKPAPLIATPTHKRGPWQARVTAFEKPGPAAEAFRHLAVRTHKLLRERDLKSVLVTSSVIGEGKTTTACNLALAMASLDSDLRIALLDLDLRCPSIASVFGVNVSGGFDRALMGQSNAADVRARTDQKGLDVYLVGERHRNAHELLTGARLPSILEELSKQYGVIVIDTPPVLPVPDTPIVAEHVGAYIPVARAGITRRSTFEEMLALMPPGKSTGVFLNDTRLTKEQVYRYD